MEIKELQKENNDLRWEKRQHLYTVGLLYLGAVILSSDKKPLWMPLVSGGLFIASIVKAKDYLKTKFVNDTKIKENNAKIMTLKKE